MTPADYAARCAAAGLVVRHAERHGAMVVVTVEKRRVPTSADGLKALAVRLGMGGTTVSFGNGTGDVKLYFRAAEDGE